MTGHGARHEAPPRVPSDEGRGARLLQVLWADSLSGQTLRGHLSYTELADGTSSRTGLPQRLFQKGLAGWGQLQTTLKVMSRVDLSCRRGRGGVPQS